MKPIFLISGTLLAFLSASPAADPAWWTTRGVKNASPASNLSPATIGQAKHMAAMALAELQTQLSPQEYSALQSNVAVVVNLAAPQSQAEFDNQRSVLLTGQLKALAKPFYDKLRTLNAVWLDNEMVFANIRVVEPGSNPISYSPYPWSVATSDDQNKAVATLGQLKAVFSLRFDTFRDADHDGLPDAWELQYFPNLDQTAGGDPDGDGLNNAQECELGFNPLVSDATVDADADGLSNLQEVEIGTDAADPDTDGDQMGDGYEVWHTFSPLVVEINNKGPDGDFDNDGTTNANEALTGRMANLFHESFPAPSPGSGMIARWFGSAGFWYTIQYSTDLINWTTHPMGFMGTNIELSVDVANWYGAPLPPSLFVRLYIGPAATADMDGDGLGAELEFELGTDPTKSDTDGDFLGDGMDAVPNEILVDWEKTTEAGYVLIDIDVPPGGIARDLNDQGEVLFDGGIWSGGEYVAIPLPETMFGSFPNGAETQTYEVDPIGYIGFSSEHKLLGWSHVRYTSGQASGGDGTDTAWSWNPSQSPTHLADDIPFNFANVLSMSPLGIDDTGRTFVRNSYVFNDPPPSTEWHEKRRVVVSGPPGGSPPVFLQPSSGFYVDGNSWQLHSDVSRSGYLVTNTASNIADLPNKTYQLAMWDTSLNELPLPAGSDGWFYPVHVTDLPNGKPALAATKAGSGGDCVFLKNQSGQMEKCDSLSGKKVRVFAGDGTAMTSDHHLWRNGKLIPMRDLCERFGDLIDDEWILQPFKSNKHGVYLIQALGPNGEQENKIAVPVEVRDEQFATGVDDVSRQAKRKSDDPGYEEDFWVMAPSGENRTNETRMLISHETAPHLKITPEVTDASITTPNPLPLSVATPKDSATWPAVTWHGMSAITKDAKIDWQIGSPNHWLNVTMPVKVKVMKGRTVKVAVWLVPCKTSNGVQSDPGVKPTKEQLDNHLNGVFKPQINALFDCIVTETSVLDYDVEDGTGFGAPALSIKPRNGWLNTNNSGVGEFKILRDNHYDKTVDINVYILGQYIQGIQSSVWITSQNPNYLLTKVPDAHGLTNIATRGIVITTGILTSNNNWEGLKDTIDHEIGHVIFGPGHPDGIEIKPDGVVVWDHAGVAPLLGVDPTTRLMCGGLKRRDEGATLIVKKEWDEAEKWLSRVSDNRIRRERNLGQDEPTGNY
jgi:hypothetical protein